jgi:hypothetical protein
MLAASPAVGCSFVIIAASIKTIFHACLIIIYNDNV